MRIALIRPHLFDSRSSDAMEPLSLAILKGLTPPDVEVSLYDERLEPVPVDDNVDLAGITVETHTARRAYQIAMAYRRRGVPVVMGGYHPTLLPEEALRFCDAIVLGDAEGVWPRVVEDARRGCLLRSYRQSEPVALNGSMPDRSIFKGKRYAPLALVQYARGCKYNCDFCSIRAFYGSRLQQRSIRDVVEEISCLGRHDVVFVDDNIFVNQQKARELFRALIPLRIRWWCQVSVDIACDRELLTLMEKSGCTGATIGFESLDPANLAQMNKRWNVRFGDYARLVRQLQDHGIMIYGTFVFGYDHDTPDSFDPVVDFALRNKFFLANFNPLTPTPGTPLIERLQREGRLLRPNWWLDPNYRYGQATFRPRGMTPEQLEEGCYRARTVFNTYGSIFRRAFNTKTTLRSPRRLGLHVMGNLVTRREIHAKQGAQLGGTAPLPDLGQVT